MCVTIGNDTRLWNEGIAEIEPVSFDELLHDHRRIAESILTGDIKVLPAFDEYLRHGYYPFYKNVYSESHVRFEVGGRKKSFEQIKDIENSYLAVDDTEIGHHNRIPLWMFGLLY